MAEALDLLFLRFVLYLKKIENRDINFYTNFDVIITIQNDYLHFPMCFKVQKLHFCIAYWCKKMIKAVNEYGRRKNYYYK